MNININGNDNYSIFKTINYEDVIKFDNGSCVLLFSAKTKNNERIINLWSGSKKTIKSAKRSTIYEDIVIMVIV